MQVSLYAWKCTTYTKNQSRDLSFIHKHNWCLVLSCITSLGLYAEPHLKQAAM